MPELDPFDATFDATDGNFDLALGGMHPYSADERGLAILKKLEAAEAKVQNWKDLGLKDDFTANARAKVEKEKQKLVSNMRNYVAYKDNRGENCSAMNLKCLLLSRGAKRRS